MIFYWRIWKIHSLMKNKESDTCNFAFNTIKHPLFLIYANRGCFQGQWEWNHGNWLVSSLIVLKDFSDISAPVVQGGFYPQKLSVIEQDIDAS